MLDKNIGDFFEALNSSDGLFQPMYEQITQLKFYKRNERVAKNNRHPTLNPPSKRVE